MSGDARPSEAATGTGIAVTLLRLYDAGELKALGLAEALWSQEVWPWTPPVRFVDPLPLVDQISDYKAALEVFLLVELEVLDERLAEARARPRDCHGVCIACDALVDEVDAAIAAAAAAVATTVPARAGAGLQGAVT